MIQSRKCRPVTRLWNISPQVHKAKITPYGDDEIRKLIEVALTRFVGVRWIIAFALGLRQGELLALQWSDVDLDLGFLTVSHSRSRPQYRHGCNPPCGKAHPGWCPDKIRINPERGEAKSDASQPNDRHARRTDPATGRLGRLSPLAL